MFTGLVQDLGTVVRIQRRGPLGRIAIRPGPGLDAADLAPGESVAVDGACLTVVASEKGLFEAEVSHETLTRTTLVELHPGALVHLERALRLGDRLGGHLVSGHVDAVGRLLRRTSVGEAMEVLFGYPRELAPYLVPKGSVAVDGVSLTVNEVGPDRFGVVLVPQTLRATHLGIRPEGSGVNLETDPIGKYVVRYLTLRRGGEEPVPEGMPEGTPGPAAGGVTLDLLARHGFLSG